MDAKYLRLLCSCWLLVCFITGTAQTPPAAHFQKIQHDWIALLFEQKIPGGFTAGYPRYFLLHTDGTVHSFEPGEQPQPVSGIDHVISLVSGGGRWILALKQDGTVWVWGRNNSNKGVYTASPVQVPGITHAVAVSSGCSVLLQDGSVWIWDATHVGLTKVQGIEHAVAIDGSLAILNDGTVWAWGESSLYLQYRLGIAQNKVQYIGVAFQVPGIDHVVAVSDGRETSIALKADGTVWCWGNINSTAHLGAGDKKVESDVPIYSSMRAEPVQAVNIIHAVAISANSTCLALEQDGTVKAWGWGAVGGMGRGVPGSNNDNHSPMPVPKVARAVGIQAGNSAGFALLKDGTIMGWGSNMVSQAVGGDYRRTWTPIVITKRF